MLISLLNTYSTLAGFRISSLTFLEFVLVHAQLGVMNPKFAKSCASLLDLRLNFIKFLVRGVIIFMKIFIAFMVGITFMGDTHETYISLSQVENDDEREPTLNFETLNECDSLAVA